MSLLLVACALPAASLAFRYASVASYVFRIPSRDLRLSSPASDSYLPVQELNGFQAAFFHQADSLTSGNGSDGLVVGRWSEQWITLS